MGSGSLPGLRVEPVLPRWAPARNRWRARARAPSEQQETEAEEQGRARLRHGRADRRLQGRRDRGVPQGVRVDVAGREVACLEQIQQIRTAEDVIALRAAQRLDLDGVLRQ